MILIMAKGDWQEEINSFMKVILLMEDFMGKVKSNGLMVIVMKEIWMIIEEKVWVNLHLLQEIIIKVNFLIINFMGKENIVGKKEMFMKVNLKEVLWQELERWIIL